MPQIFYRDRGYALAENENVLDCLERNGHKVFSSCRSGICQSCVLRADAAELPPQSQKGLRDAQVKQGYFLSCSCVPTADLRVFDCDDVGQIAATVESVEPLGGRIVRLRLQPDGAFDYMPGQFLNLILPDNTVRSYSIASVPGLDPWLELHIALLPGGKTSRWLQEEAKSGGGVSISGPLGQCCYSAKTPDQPLLLLATGTGLAPLYGVLRDAVKRGHNGAIRVYHGCRTAEDVYYRAELQELADAHPNINYYAGVLLAENAGDLPVGDVLAKAVEDIGDFKGWQAYLCGHPDFVNQAKRKIFLAGASMSDIFADAFLPAGK